MTKVICPTCGSRKFEIDINPKGRKSVVILTCECGKFSVSYIVKGESI